MQGRESLLFGNSPTCLSMGFQGRRRFLEPTPPLETLEEHFGMFIQNDKHAAPHFISLFFTQCIYDEMLVENLSVFIVGCSKLQEQPYFLPAIAFAATLFTAPLPAALPALSNDFSVNIFSPNSGR